MNQTKYISLTRGFVACIDEEDYAKVCQYKWTALVDHRRNTVYGCNCRIGYLHRFLVSAPVGLEVDHIDGDGLNNRRSNLQLCTHYVNMQNKRKGSPRFTSRFRGVSRHGKGWRASVYLNKKRAYSGSFSDEVEAAKACDANAIRLLGNDAKLNFPGA